MIKNVIREAIARFPNDKARQNDFVRSWWGIVRKFPGKHKQRSDMYYGRGRRAFNKFPLLVAR